MPATSSNVQLGTKYNMWELAACAGVIVSLSCISRLVSGLRLHPHVQCPFSLLPTFFHCGHRPRPLSGPYNVGMRVSSTVTGSRFRLFYPCVASSNPQAPWLVVNIGAMLKALFHARFSLQVLVSAVQGFAAFVGFCLPANGMRLPARVDAPAEDDVFPLVVFSHGLFGVGSENSLMACEWASHGFRVAVVLHLDGSASAQYNAQGRYIKMDVLPKDPTDRRMFRSIQIRKRAAEVCSVVHHAREKSEVLLAGFSYGGSTALLAAQELESLPVRGVLVMDGWFFNEYPFPQDLFRDGQRKYPACFLVSHMFSHWDDNHTQVKRLVTDMDSLEVIPSTNHGNFSEQLFWNPFPFALKIFPLGIGSGNPVDVYYGIVARSLQFFKKHA